MQPSGPQISQWPPPAGPPEERAKRPWLPARHVIGLAAVALFIAGSIFGGAAWISKSTDELAAQAERFAVSIDEEMTSAMVRGDREAFVSWGEGQGAEQLARLWDETKKIGWKTGSIGWTPGELSESASGEVEFTGDPIMQFAVALGFDNTRNAGDYGGALWQSVDYKLTVTGEYGDTRITSLTPVTPMPWDDPEGLAVVSSDNVILFSYADEAHLLDDAIADGQEAAEQLLRSQLAQRPEAHVEGFVGFLTTDRERWEQGVYAPGDPQSNVGREAVAVTKLYSDAPFVGEEAENQPGLAWDGGSLVFFSDKAVSDNLFRTMAHEFAHSLHHAYVPEISGSILGADAEVGIRAVTEGYGVLSEEMIGGARDGQLRTGTEEVRNAVVNGDLARITDTAAYASTDDADLAYNVAGNYLRYASAQGADIGVMIADASYTVVPFWMWVDQPEQGLSTEGWKEWAAAQ